jgi:hypothetical protein
MENRPSIIGKFVATLRFNSLQMNKNQQNILAVLLVIAAVAFRMINHSNHFLNFAPMLAISLFAGYLFKGKQTGYLVALGAAVLSDVCVGLFTSDLGYYGPSQLITYLAYVLVVALGSTMKSASIVRALGYGVASSVVFFVVSNLGVWLDTTFNMYPKTLAGLGACFTAAVAFYRQQVDANLFFNPITADAIYAVLIFGTYTLATKTFTKRAIA